MKKLFAAYYDAFMNPLEKRLITSWRKDLLKHAKGSVIEIGAGTGVNFPLYEHCDEVIAIEPNQHMIKKAIERKKQTSIPISIYETKAEKLPFPDHHFDTVVVTLVLCSVDEPSKVLLEIMRVLKPNGKVLLLEHVKMDHPIFSKFQTMFTPVWKQLCDGCHLNRKTEKYMKEAGFSFLAKQSYLSGFAVSIIATK
ncbi:class I SAM-dependent methyltransferase [Halalkalibacter kiskunsagensis]|uniref:Class I SAM-dependent methyltransferase n=1 Tax=Halalkalibacter kiskunsagensis TaxID=1548599 RepID=A0ABV6KIN2_9BACI